MATAYDVMSMAKRQGAEVSAIEKFNDYMERIKTEEARASKAGLMGKIGGGVGGSIASFLAPAAIAALGIGTGGLGTMLLAGALGTSISRGGTELGDFLGRQWTMGGKGRGKEFKDIGRMERVKGPYGQRQASKLQHAGKEKMEGQRDTIAELLDVENTQRWLTSGMSGISAAGKARSAAESLGLGGQSMTEVLGGDTTFGERMMAGIRGDVGEGYKLGAGDTGDFWRNKFGKVPSSISAGVDKVAPFDLKGGSEALWKEQFGAGSMSDRAPVGVTIADKYKPELAIPKIGDISTEDAPISEMLGKQAYGSRQEALGQQLMQEVGGWEEMMGGDKPLFSPLSVSDKPAVQTVFPTKGPGGYEARQFLKEFPGYEATPENLELWRNWEGSFGAGQDSGVLDVLKALYEQGRG